MNDNLATIIIAHMTTKSHGYPYRVEVSFKNKKGCIVLDQIRTVDKGRLVKELGVIDASTIHKVKAVMQEMLVE
jgi:mRNA interferase MazF